MKRARLEVSFRQANVSDARSIARLNIETYRVAFRGVLPDAHLDGLNVDSRAETWEQRMASTESTRHHCIVADSELGIVGFVAVAPTRDADEDRNSVGEVVAIYVHPDHWNRGIGRKLMSRAIASLRHVGHVQASIWTFEGTERARRFYEAGGWRFDGSTKVLELGLPVVLVRYRLDLSKDEGKGPSKV